ncbi:hypothetical protein C8T65DRAFT_67619 [Cerioporus squamosus]|nr:hypothetical protein C8T65DRAFT_67619 [Cerioporus squamosus]
MYTEHVSPDRSRDCGILSRRTHGLESGDTSRGHASLISGINPLVEFSADHPTDRSCTSGRARRSRYFCLLQRRLRPGSSFVYAHIQAPINEFAPALLGGTTQIAISICLDIPFVGGRKSVDSNSPSPVASLLLFCPPSIFYRTLPPDQSQAIATANLLWGHPRWRHISLIDYCAVSHSSIAQNISSVQARASFNVPLALTSPCGNPLQGLERV